MDGYDVSDNVNSNSNNEQDLTLNPTFSTRQNGTAARRRSTPLDRQMATGNNNFGSKTKQHQSTMTMMPQRLVALSLLVLATFQSSLAFVSPPRIALISSSRTPATSSCYMAGDESSSDPLLDSPDELSQFEKDLLEAFGTEDQDDALTNAAFSAFARDLQNVDEIDEWGAWNADNSDDDFLISEEEAFELYTETMNDMISPTSAEEGVVDLEQFSVEVPDDEKQLVEDMVASANKAIESIWGEQGMTNPVRDYFKGVKDAQEGGDSEEDKA